MQIESKFQQGQSINTNNHHTWIIPNIFNKQRPFSGISS
jgi:hypothetical protein